jgi:hypothetical protein
MAEVSKVVLKAYFEDGKEPDENKFINLIDTLWPSGDISWIDYSGDSNIVGFATYDVKQIGYGEANGKLVFVQFYIGGNPNGTVVTFTLPISLSGGFGVMRQLIDTFSNGAHVVGYAELTGSTVTCKPDLAGSAWPAGWRHVVGEFWYLAA